MAEWQDIVERIQTQRPEVAAVLEHAVLLEHSRARAVIGWPPNSVLSSQYDDALLLELVRNAETARGFEVADILITKNDPRAQGCDTLASFETAERTRKYRESQAFVRNHPRVKDAIELMGARIVSVKLAGQ
jgi:D-hexose-6-phosphate mutarotase